MALCVPVWTRDGDHVDVLLDLLPIAALVGVLAGSLWLSPRYGPPARQDRGRAQHDLTPIRRREPAERVFAIGASYKSAS